MNNTGHADWDDAINFSLYEIIETKNITKIYKISVD